MERYELMRKHYGKINIASIPSEVRTIWYTKEQEPDPCEVAEEFRFDNNYGNSGVTSFEHQEFLQFILNKSCLIDRLYEVVYLYFFDNCTFAQIADELNISNARAQQLLAKALRRIRFICGSYGYIHYFD